MSRRVPASVGMVTTVLAMLWLAPALAQTPPSGAKRNANPPRTAWGHPDLQGVWDFATITPLERPADLAGKEFLTPEEAAAYERLTLERRDQDRREGAGTNADVARAYNQFWWDFGTRLVGTRRTSLVVDPPDGKVPPLTPAGQQRADARAAARERPAAGPEDRNLWERCLMGGNAGPPMLPGAYNNNVQLFQTPSAVVIFNEMINDARVVPLDGRAHVDSGIRLWRGDSRGRWEGNTLVVETTNFRSDANFRGATEKLRVVERFTRADAETLLYEFTVSDPQTWTKPWSVAVPMTRTAGPIYEYACHEGNYGMVNILTGARAQERAGK